MEDDVLEEAEEQRPEPRRRSATCPKCGSGDIRRSNYESLWVSINQTLGRWPFRCRNCQSLFFRAGMRPPNA